MYWRVTNVSVVVIFAFQETKLLLKQKADEALQLSEEVRTTT